MTSLYKNKYRVESSRLKDWDYSNAGYYYITICTKDGYPYFGKIHDRKIQLSRIGEIVENEWRKTSDIRKHIIIDEYYG